MRTRAFYENIYNIPSGVFIAIPKGREIKLYGRKIGELLQVIYTSSRETALEIAQALMNENTPTPSKYDDPALYDFCRYIRSNKSIDTFNLSIKDLYNAIKKQPYYKPGHSYQKIDRKQPYSLNNLTIK